MLYFSDAVKKICHYFYILDAFLGKSQAVNPSYSRTNGTVELASPELEDHSTNDAMLVDVTEHMIGLPDYDSSCQSANPVVPSVSRKGISEELEKSIVESLQSRCGQCKSGLANLTMVIETSRGKN